MSFLPSDYTNLPSSGIVGENLAPSDEFSFGYAFTYTKDVNIEEGYRTPFEAHITLELRDSGGTLKATFDGFETYDVDLFPMSPGLAFYSWAWDINKEEFSAQDAAGDEIETVEQFSLGVIPGGKSDLTDRTALVDSVFYSLIFKIDIDPGDVLKITFHNASAGFVTDRASLQVATRKRAGAPPGLFDARCGQQFHAVIDGKNTRVMRSRFSASPIPQSSAEWGLFGDTAPGLVTTKALQNMRLWRRAGGGLYLFGSVATRYQILRSFDEAENWEQIMAITSTVAPLAVCPSQDGSTLFIYGTGADKKAAFTILKNGKEGWIVSETGACSGENLPVSSINSLEISDGGLLRLLATGSSKALLLFTSPDGKAYTQQAVQ